MPVQANADEWLSRIDLERVFSMLRDNGVTDVLYKVLPQNANSKNQVYLASDFSQLGKIPMGEVTAHASTTRKRDDVEAVFRASLDLQWLDRDGHLIRAPHSKLIFYPQYPEVRLSGFLLGCPGAPSSLWVKDQRGAEPGRILVLGFGHGNAVVGLTLPPESPAAREILASGPHDAYGAPDDRHGVLRILSMSGGVADDGFADLMHRLCVIHHRGWVPSSRLDPDGTRVPCLASNCNGNTLESLLGIRSNGYALPDFRGWELKARNVRNADRPGASVVTLFTPEPTSGAYVSDGFVAFMHRYGHADTRGRPDRLNFGGIHRVGAPANERTHLRMVLDGFDPGTGRFAGDGAIRLVSASGDEAMSWPFAKLMDHWKTKHAHATYVPSQGRDEPGREYRFGRNVLIGEGARFGLFLRAVHDGKVYYDPGIKLECVSTAHPRGKKRSQFRVSSADLPALYETSRIVDVCAVTAPAQ